MNFSTYFLEFELGSKNIKGYLTISSNETFSSPRRLTDLIGSLSDLTSGSGDKGTPIIFIQGYFDNYTK